MITQALQDLRQNLWLIDDILSGTNNPEIGAVYAQEIQNCKDWFKNNEIKVFSKHQALDKMEFPCVTIGLGSSSEKSDMATMGDRDTESQILAPTTIGRPIPFIIKPFTPTGINIASGLVKIPTTVDTTTVNIGMSFLNPETGDAYPIINQDSDGFYVAAYSMANASFKTLAIIPQYPFYKVRRERGWFDESYTIGCHTVGDVSTLLWLHAIVLYSVLRYREVLLEHRGFMQSSVYSTDISNNSNYSAYVGGDRVFTRNITISGIVQNDWLKQPQRYVEQAVPILSTSPAGSTDPVVDFFNGPLNIVSN